MRKRTLHVLAPYKPLAVIAGAALFLGLGIWLGGQSGEVVQRVQQNEASEQTGPYEVVGVVDGDTIRVRINNTVEPVRLIGIDAPEVDTPYTDKECYGSEAVERAKGLLEGQEIMLEADPSQDDRDTYDRLLRYVFLDDININQLLIEEGRAYEYTFREAYRYQDDFTQAQQAARSVGNGLWSDSTCSGLREPISPDLTGITHSTVTPHEGCISFDAAPDHVGAHTCVTGRVDHVYVSHGNTTFINFCADYLTCPFSSVIFDDSSHEFANIQSIEGQKISITGTINTYEGRPQIILNKPSQLQKH